MSRRRWAGLVAAVLALALPAVPARALAGNAINQPGTYSLQALGSPPLTLTPDHLKQAVPVVLPAGAAQGPSSWWHIFLHARVTFAPSAHGTWYLTGWVNGAASAAAEFNLDAGPPGGMSWNTVDIDGEVRHESTTRVAEFDFSNYVQNDGVRPGPGTVEFGMEPLDAASTGLTGATIDAARSGLIWDNDAPDDLHLTIAAPTADPVDGRPFSVTYHVLNTDETPATGLVLVVAAGSSTATEVHLPTVAHSLDGSLKFAVDHSGPWELDVTLVNSRHKARATQRLSLTVQPKPTSPVRWIVLVIGVVVLAAGVVVYRRGARDRASR